MTVERLIEWLQNHHPQAVVFATVTPCVVGAAPGYTLPSYEGEVMAVRSDSRKGRVYIEADGHDC